MSIHSEIKRLRKAKGWSHQQLAAAISEAEGLVRPLTWQTVQQWEREPVEGAAGKSTAPKRKRLQTVARLLGTTAESLLAGAPSAPNTVADLSGEEGLLLGLFRALSTADRERVMHEARERAAPYSSSNDKQQRSA